MMERNPWIVISGIVGAAGVIIGAFGAHVLPDWLTDAGLAENVIADRMETFETGVRYHMYHAAALFALGALLAKRGRSWKTTTAGMSFLLGILVFSGLLYAIAFSGVSWLGAVVPIGGVLMIVGWCMVVVIGLRH